MKRHRPADGLWQCKHGDDWTPAPLALGSGFAPGPGPRLINGIAAFRLVTRTVYSLPITICQTAPKTR